MLDKLTMIGTWFLSAYTFVLIFVMPVAIWVGLKKIIKLLEAK